MGRRYHGLAGAGARRARRALLEDDLGFAFETALAGQPHRLAPACSAKQLSSSRLHGRKYIPWWIHDKAWLSRAAPRSSRRGDRDAPGRPLNVLAFSGGAPAPTAAAPGWAVPATEQPAARRSKGERPVRSCARAWARYRERCGMAPSCSGRRDAGTVCATHAAEPRRNRAPPGSATTSRGFRTGTLPTSLRRPESFAHRRTRTRDSARHPRAASG